MRAWSEVCKTPSWHHANLAFLSIFVGENLKGLQCQIVKGNLPNDINTPA